MAFCRNCGNLFDWGYDTSAERWVPLEPVATHDDLDKSYVDEVGALRADHRDRCRGKTVNVERLTHKVPAEIELKPEPADDYDDVDDVGEGQDQIASETGWFARMRRSDK